MLVLTRKLGERIYIGPDIFVTVLETKHNRVRLGINAPDDVPILREEIVVTVDPDDSPEILCS